MNKRDNVPSATLPLAWLESYLAVYKHCDITLAADECGRTVNVIKDHVEKLERWMHRPLIVGSERSLVLAEERPPQVATTADKILRSFDRATAQIRGESPPDTLSLVSSFRSEITLFQLEVISGLRRGIGIEEAAYLGGRTGKTGRREIIELERLIGLKLVGGASFTRVTQQGHSLAVLADNISTLLRNAQAEIDKSEVLKARARKRQGALIRELMLYEHFHHVMSNYKRLSTENLDLLVEMEARLKQLRADLAKSREEFGSLPQIDEFEKDLPSFYKFSRRRSACGKRIILSSKPIRSVSSVIHEVSFPGHAPMRNQRGRFT